MPAKRVSSRSPSRSRSPSKGLVDDDFLADPTVAGVALIVVTLLLVQISAVVSSGRSFTDFLSFQNNFVDESTTLFRQAGGDGENLSSSFPFSLGFALYVYHAVKSAPNTGFWLGNVLAATFGAFAPTFFTNAIDGNAWFSGITENQIALVFVLWFVRNKKVLPGGQSVSELIEGFLGPIAGVFDKVAALCAVGYTTSKLFGIIGGESNCDSRFLFIFGSGSPFNFHTFFRLIFVASAASFFPLNKGVSVSAATGAVEDAMTVAVIGVVSKTAAFAAFHSYLTFNWFMFAQLVLTAFGFLVPAEYSPKNLFLKVWAFTQL